MQRFLASDYAAKGSKRALQGGTEVYVASPATETGKAIIYFSDVWGWDSGRTRAICDFLAEQGYKVCASPFSDAILYTYHVHSEAGSVAVTFEKQKKKQLPCITLSSAWQRLMFDPVLFSD